MDVGCVGTGDVEVWGMGAYGREEDVTKKAWVKSGTEYIRREI